MASESPFWREEFIAHALLLKLRLRVCARTLREYLPKRPPGGPRGDQRCAIDFDTTQPSLDRRASRNACQMVLGGLHHEYLAGASVGVIG